MACGKRPLSCNSANTLWPRMRTEETLNKDFWRYQDALRDSYVSRAPRISRVRLDPLWIRKRTMIYE